MYIYVVWNIKKTISYKYKIIMVDVLQVNIENLVVISMVGVEKLGRTLQMYI